MASTPAAAASAASASGSRVKSWLLAALFLLIAVHFALNLQQNGKTFLDAAAYVGLHEKRPYQYRVLMAPVLGWLIEAMSQPAARAFTSRLPTYIGSAESAAYFTVNAVAFTLSCVLMRGIARRALSDSSSGPLAARTAVAVYIGLAYGFFCLNPNVAFILPYDTVGLALSQACILCILAGRRGWLYPAFALATLNRETSFLVIVFLAARVVFDTDRPGAGLPTRVVWQTVAGLCAVWLAIKVALYLCFADLPSDEGLRIVDNLRVLMKPWQWPAILPVLAAFALSLRTLIRLPAGREWPFVGCLGFLMLCVVGQIIETRVFGDLMVFWAIAIARAWCSAAGARRDPRASA